MCGRRYKFERDGEGTRGDESVEGDERDEEEGADVEEKMEGKENELGGGKTGRAKGSVPERGEM